MRTHTNEFKQEIKKLGRQINGKIYVYSNYDLSSENNNNILTEDDIQIISEKFNKQEATEIDSNLIYSMNIIKNGNLLKSLMKEFDFEAKYDLNIGTAVNPHFGLLVNNSYEYLDYGDYIIYSKEYNLDSETWNYVCYDMMLYSMIKYTPIKDITYPTTIRSYISAIADKMGVEFANKEDEFVNYDQLVNEELFKDKGYTLRDILDKLSEVTASNIIINDNNELEIKYPEKNITEEKTVEGTNISISDNVGDTISDLQLQGNTYQQTYTGKNLLPSNNITQTINGITFTRNSDGSIKISGIATAQTVYRVNIVGSEFTLSSGTYTISTKNNIPTGTQFQGWYSSGQNFLNINSSSNKRTQTINSNVSNVRFQIVVANGTNISTPVTIYPQLEKNSEATTYEPYVGGTPSPNPDYPQPIQNVTGRQTIDVVGKNFFDKDKSCNYKSNNDVVEVNINTGKKISWTSSTSSTYKFVDYAIMDLTNFVGKTIRFKCNFNASGSNIAQYYIGLCDKDGNNRINKSQTTTSGTTLNFTVPELSGEQKYLCLALYVNTTGTLSQNDYVEYTNMMLTIDDEDMTYEEYKGQSYEINLGKNLFDKDNANVLNAYFNTSTNKLTQSGAGVKSLYIPCKPNTTYTVQKTLSTRFGVACTREIPVIGETIYNASVHATWNNITITTDSQAKYLVVEYYISSDTLTPEEIMDTIQIETGSQATSYSPYFTPIELNKIGNYQDRIYKENGTWYIEKNIGKAIIDGTSGTFSNPSANRFNIDDLITDFKKIDISNLSFSNYYKSYYQVGTNGQFNELVENVNYGFDFSSSLLSNTLRFKNTDITSVNDFKTWLSTHNTIVYYVLSTPTYTEITNTDLINQLESIELLKGINNITVSSGDLAGGLKIKYVSEYETINEQYLKDINVAFGEQFGPINRVSIADSEDNYEYYAEDMTSISKNKKTQINIIDNEFVFNDDTQTICQAIFDKLNGLNYSLNDFATTGVCYYDFLDIYNVQAKGNTYQCLLLNNEISINQGIEENIFTEEPENNEKSSNNYETSILSNKAVSFKINQQEKRLEQAVMEDNVIASLNLAIEDGQGVIEIKGNQVTIESDNFTLDADGSIEATAGEIGGYSIGTNQLSTQISKTYTFTQDDVNTVRNIMLGNIQPTEEQVAKYDVNGNGYIEISDLAIIVSIVSGGGTKTFTGEISINNDDFNRVIRVTDSDGIKNSIGMLGSYFSYLGAKAIDLQNSSNQRCEIMPNEIYLVDYSGSSPSSTTITAQGILSPTITQTSLESAKKNFELLENALEIIKNIDIYKYQLKNEEDAAKKHIGFIIGDDYKYSEEVTSNENNGVDIYSFVSVCCKAIKEQQEIIDKMQQEIEFLKKESGK